jgi:beta-N-acetylhexosaminidase
VKENNNGSSEDNFAGEPVAKTAMDIAKERRALRRKRRVRNQIIAYLVAVFLLTGLVIGVNFGVGRVVDYVKEWRAERAAAAAAEAAALEAEQKENEEPSEPQTTPEPVEIEDGEGEGEEEIIVIEVDPLDVFVGERIAELSLEEKVAGLFIITPEALTGATQVTRAGDTTEQKLQEYAVGGRVYSGQNIQSATQIAEMLDNTTRMSRYPIFLAVDEEGGRVARIASRNLVNNVGPMAAVGATGEAGNAYETAITIGTYMSRYGFNTNFAPVADVLRDEDNVPIGDRSFGSDPTLVADMVAAFVRGMKEMGIYSTLKHFPGLGDTADDTHVGMAVTERTLDEMRMFEFLPFIAGIEAGAEFVMVSHVSARSIDDTVPASLSATIITNILRGELGFDGIVITDALNMGAITEYYTADEACLMALEAGADMLLMPEDFELAYTGVLQAVQNGELSEERINKSLMRIYRVKHAGWPGE